MKFEILYRHFLESITSLIVALTLLLSSVPPLVQAIKRSVKAIKELVKIMKRLATMRTETKNVATGAKETTHLWPFTVFLVLGIVLAVLGVYVLKGRASVAETGKSIGSTASFSVDENYAPTGITGDIGDVTVSKQEDFVRFVYQAEGRGPHEWEYKYIQGKENPRPAQFGGVMYLDPRGNWGTDPDGGYDLRTCHRVIKWEARTTDGEVNVEFVIGGDKGQSGPKGTEQFAYPNTINRNFGVRHLNSQWQSFEADLSKVSDERFKRVVGGFGWVITWGSNGIKLSKDQSGPEKAKTFTIEIRNVRYEK